MIALGCDISTRKIAVAGIREDGSLVTRALELSPDARGARRLVGARLTAYAALGGHAGEAAVIVIENPYNRGFKGTPGMALLGVAFVCIEAAQSACPGAVVMDCPPATWRKSVLGHGRADKDDAVRFAAGLGYDGNDLDIAEALCIAQHGWERWHASQTVAA